MTLKNKATGKTISKDLKICNSFIDQMLGLLLNSNPRTLLFKTRFGIHTFLLKESIDILVLNKKSQIMKLKKNLKPNRVFFWNPKYDTVIELPKNTIDKHKLKVHNYLQLQ